MPELPEVETIRRSLEPSIRGRRVASVYGSRARLRTGPAPAAALRRHWVERRLERIERRGKFLSVHVRESPIVLLLHLGMSGRLLLEPTCTPRPPHTHLELGLEGGHVLRLISARRFAQALCFDARTPPHDLPLARLGPEPLSGSFNGKRLHQALRRRKAPIKAALLDQSLVAGLGNIYVCEALWEAGIDPRRPANHLSETECIRLAKAIRRVLRKAIRNCGTTLRDYRDGWGVRGRYQAMLEVYGRTGQPCRRCRRPIERLLQAGRSSFACPNCQR